MIKKIFISIFLICSFLLYSSCQTQENKYRTKVFHNYLQKTFQRTLSQEEAIYIGIASSGCPTCKTSLLQYLQTQTTMKLNLIVTQDWEMKLPDNIEMLYDEDATINNLNMKTSGTYVLFIKGRKIVETFSVTPPGLPVLDKKLKAFLAKK